jgi:aspartate/methionine/tyrosine aminotransferase
VWFRLPDGLTTESLLEEHRVAVAPGEGFGDHGRGWARLSLATDDVKLGRGLERLRGAFGV